MKQFKNYISAILFTVALLFSSSAFSDNGTWDNDTWNGVIDAIDHTCQQYPNRPECSGGTTSVASPAGISVLLASLAATLYLRRKK